MFPTPIPADLGDTDERMALVETLLGHQLARVRTFRALTTLNVFTLDHPAARNLFRHDQELWRGGAALWRGEDTAVTALGLLNWSRAVLGAWQSLLREVPPGVEAALEAVAPAPSAEVIARLDATTEAPPAALRQRWPWRPRPLPVDGSIGDHLRTLTPAALRETAEYTTRRAHGSAAVLRAACAEVLEDPTEVVHQCRNASGTGLNLLRVLLRADGPVALAELPLQWGALLQERAPWKASGLAMLQRLGLVFVGLDPATQVVAVTIPRAIREVLSGFLPRPQAELPGLELEVRISGLHPPVWRRFRLRGDASLGDLHLAIQDAFAWQNSHMFEFFAPDAFRSHVAGLPSPHDLDADVTDAWTVPVSDALPEPEATLLYVYDFGDDWEHVVRLHSVMPGPLRAHRQLVDGGRAGPLEDCGGPPGYADCVAVAMGARNDPERKKWMGLWDPEFFRLSLEQAEFDL